MKALMFFMPLAHMTVTQYVIAALNNAILS